MFRILAAVQISRTNLKTTMDGSRRVWRFVYHTLHIFTTQKFEKPVGGQNDLLEPKWHAPEIPDIKQRQAFVALIKLS